MNWRSGSRPPDVIGLGALNIDYIAGASTMSDRMMERVAESTARFEWNRESPVEESAIVDAMRHLGAASLGCSLGGSAWLAIFALAQMRLGLRLGYVGVVGRIETPGLSFTGQMDELQVDRTWVGKEPSLPCGICLSYIDDTDRVMLIYPGANLTVGRQIRQNFEGIADYLSSARCVHVTSFLDDRTPAEVLRVLVRAKELNPGLLLSFDPGFDWAAHPTPAIEAILAIADLLFVNYREFKAIGRHAPGEDDGAIAQRVLRRCAPGCRLFLTKRYDYVEAFHARPGAPEQLRARRFQLRRVIPEVALEDATGAGDVFVAAVLGALLSDRLQVELGAHVGLSLARHKLLHRQPGRSSLPDLSSDYLQASELPAQMHPYPRGVFIAHHNHPQYDQVRRFIEQDCGLTSYDSGSVGTDGATASEAMSEQLARCSFAVCLLACGDPTTDGREPLDQSIVHQAGLFQGSYGFGRVAILAEEGCSTFSNIAGLIRLEFPAGRVDSSFLELERMLEREGLLLRGDGRHA